MDNRGNPRANTCAKTRAPVPEYGFDVGSSPELLFFADASYSMSSASLPRPPGMAMAGAGVAQPGVTALGQDGPGALARKRLPYPSPFESSRVPVCRLAAVGSAPTSGFGQFNRESGRVLS